MINKKSVAWFGVGFFLFLDRLFKFLSTSVFTTPHTPTSWFGWLPFHNHGAAFGLPVPTHLIVLVSLPIVLYIGWLAVQNRARTGDRQIFYLIFAGASSNLYDRLANGYTNDYLLLITGVFNLADVMILFGLLLYITFHQHNEDRTITASS